MALYHFVPVKPSRAKNLNHNQQTPNHQPWLVPKIHGLSSTYGLGFVDYKVLWRFLSQNCANQGELAQEIRVFSNRFNAELREFGQKAARKIISPQTLSFRIT